MISVQSLFYGDHPLLARRLLSSWRTTDWSLVRDVRLGFNAASPAVKAVVAAFAREWPVPVLCYNAPSNPGKYPLWRRMTCGLSDDDYVAWFDDDVAVADKIRWPLVFARILQRGPTAAGNPQLIDPKGRQFEGFAAQPWYSGKPWHHDGRPGRRRDRIWFLTGKFLVLSKAFMSRWDFPFPELHHCGGDTALGELLRQQDAVVMSAVDGEPLKRIVDYSDPPRRGIDQPRLWHDWPAPPREGLHSFECRVVDPERLCSAAMQEGGSR